MPARSHSMHIAIVDDNQSMRDALGSLIRGLGHEVRLYLSAEACLEATDLHETACVIADVQMPGMGGIELLKRLREAGSKIPVVIITAYPRDSGRRTALSEGALAYLEKPLHEERLLAFLAAAIRSD